MSEQLVRRLQDQAAITKSQLQRSLMRLNLNQRIEMARRGRKSLYESVAVYADAKQLIDIKTIGMARYGAEVKTVTGVKKISIVFARHGIFVETGAAPKTRNKKPIQYQQRTPKKWLSTVLPDEVEMYRQIVFEEYGAELAKDLRLVINGIFDSDKSNKFK